MHFDIQLRFQPSPAFIGILADMNERYADWTDGSYDWANQTEDFLASPAALPDVDESLLQTPLSKRAVNDTLQIAIALLSGARRPQGHEAPNTPPASRPHLLAGFGLSRTAPAIGWLGGTAPAP
ncbi:hypothetical protein [Oleiagrimonas soli]|nr:hypothetical protein [Oleiagrimonas soli]MBB6182934.1 hypothetical protein [Oleiagrimonas soli]